MKGHNDGSCANLGLTSEPLALNLTGDRLLSFPLHYKQVLITMPGVIVQINI